MGMGSMAVLSRHLGKQSCWKSGLEMYGNDSGRIYLLVIHHDFDHHLSPRDSLVLAELHSVTFFPNSKPQN